MSNIFSGTPFSGTIASFENNGEAGIAVLGSSNSYLFLGDAATQTGAGAIRYNHSSDAMYLRTVGANRVAIDSSGNVGVGIDSPAAKLQINDTDGGHAIRVTNIDNSNVLVGYGGGGTDLAHNMWIGSAGEGLYYQYNNGTLKNVFRTNGSSYFNGGNLGVGTTNPNEILEIAKAAASTGIRLHESSDVGSYPAMFSTFRSRGTNINSPTTISNGNAMGGIEIGAYDSSTFAAGAVIMGRAAETWTSSAHGTDLRFLTTDSGTSTLDERMRIAENGNVYLSETSNSKMSRGLTINQSTYDNEILSLKSSDVNHGMTSITETDTFGMFAKTVSTGAMDIIGFGSGDIGLQFQGYCLNETYGAGAAPFRLIGGKKSGSSVTSVYDDKSIVSFANYTNTRYYFTGDGHAYADHSWNTFSDNRLKQDIEDSPYGLDEIMRLKPKKYTRYSGELKPKDGSNEKEIVLEDGSGRAEVGLLAQDVYQVMPEIVDRPVDENNSFWGMSYDHLAPVIIKAIQQLNSKVVKQNRLMMPVPKNAMNLTPVNTATLAVDDLAGALASYQPEREKIVSSVTRTPRTITVMRDVGGRIGDDSTTGIVKMPFDKVVYDEVVTTSTVSLGAGRVHIGFDPAKLPSKYVINTDGKQYVDYMAIIAAQQAQIHQLQQAHTQFVNRTNQRLSALEQ